VNSQSSSPALVIIHSKIAAEFERARKIHTPLPNAPSTGLKSELTLADRAAPILRRITARPANHTRRDCVSYEIVEPKVDDLEALFDEALASLGFEPESCKNSKLWS
jgi:hypothetical protein